jgi:hypothetical protein
MATQSNTQPAVQWDEMVEQVKRSFDLNDPADRSAIEQWLNDVEQVRQQAAVNDIVTLFTSPEVLAGALAFFIADIEDNRALYHLRLARIRRQQQQMNLKLILGVAQGCFPNEQAGEQVVPEMLAVMKANQKAQQQMLADVVAMSHQLAQGETAAEELAWPAALGSGIQQYAADLVEFLSRNGDAGRQLVQRVCQDRNYAQEAAQEQQLPQCIQFLAGIVTKVSNSLPQVQPERRMGFQLAGRAAG